MNTIKTHIKFLKNFLLKGRKKLYTLLGEDGLDAGAGATRGLGAGATRGLILFCQVCCSCHTSILRRQLVGRFYLTYFH